MSRPRIALILTAWYPNSHADVLGRRLIEGYEWGGSRVPSRVEVVSAYVDRPGVPGAPTKPEIGAQVLAAAGIPVFGTVAEAMGLGRGGVAVDGVVVVGEHGAYGESEFGQILYPRRRLLESAISAMVAAGRFVPIVNDKHLAWDTADAVALTATVTRLGIPLLAGSSVPLAWRTGDLTWPLGAAMTRSVSVGYGPYDAYGAHVLELAQSYQERRAGGETGVESVATLWGDRARAALLDGTVDRALYEAALAVGGAPAAQTLTDPADALDPVIFLVRHRDGLRAAHVNHAASGRFSFAAAGPDARVAVRAHLQPTAPFDHFTFLARQAENLMLTGVPAWPLERVLLTTGILDAGMRSLAATRNDGFDLDAPLPPDWTNLPGAVATPDLALTYDPIPEPGDTGVGRPVPDWPER